MISLPEARTLVLQRALRLRPTIVAAVEALGMVLAEDVASDVDSPPHDKALMDGYAVAAADVRQGEAELSVLEEIEAGALPTREVARGAATRIMTGAPIPPGADAVVMIERTELCAGRPDRVRIRDPGAAPGQNILPRGAAFRRGEALLAAGRTVRPADVGLLAEAGAAQVAVVRRPRVAILATGNELTPPEQRPAPGQIRNSNGPMLCALAAQAGAAPVDLQIGRDDERQLRQLIRRGLQHDALLLSGGVSAGVRDLTPRALQDEGVQQVFHKVRLKPGKPLWFGVCASDQGDKLVFGLPGNPVSAFVCFQLLVRPALAQMAGRGAAGPPMQRAELAREHTQSGDRPALFPSALSEQDGRLVAAPLAWRGSADLRTLTEANCLAYFPAGDRRFAAGEPIDVFLLE